MSMSDHEHDDQGNCIPPESPLYPGGLPTWRFSPWDIAGIVLTGVGGVFSVAGQTANLLARECSAMANFNRAEFDQARAEREAAIEQWRMADDLRKIVLGEDES